MAAYYNEFDPKAAAWLRELIKRGLIADGEVDERSILDVVEGDLRGFTQCHFFAGIGGWSYALRLAGWPDDHPVWTGSPPCQPFSSAGQQKGKTDDRHLAPHFAALVAAGRPPILFGEQVASAAVFGKAAKRSGDGADGAPQWAWIDDLSGRLEDAHYAVGASDIPAAGVGAPHLRQRTFFGAVRLADAHREPRRTGHGGCSGEGSGAERLVEHAGGLRPLGRLADAQSIRGNGPIRRNQWQGLPEVVGRGYDGRLAYAERNSDRGKIDAADHGRNEEADRPASGLGGRGGASDGLADISISGWREERPVGGRRGPRDRAEGRPARHDAGGGLGGLGNPGGPAGQWDAGSVFGEETQEHGARGAIDGRVPVGPEHAGAGVGWLADGQRPRAPHSPWADADWLFCRDGKWRPVEPGTFPLAHGIPARVVRLRGYGNAIVPQAAAEFIEAFMEAHQEATQ